MEGFIYWKLEPVKRFLCCRIRQHLPQEGKGQGARFFAVPRGFFQSGAIIAPQLEVLF